MIQAKNLTKTFNRGTEEVTAVNDLTFQVNRGEVFGLLGPNGAGKTTTLRMILGLLEPSSGSVTVAEHDVKTDPIAVKKNIGYASVSVGVYPWLSAREMLLFVADLYSMNRELAVSRVDELAELFGFKRLLNQRCATFSSGERQRVNLARALIHDPPVMLMDEPTTGLDVVGSSLIFDYVKLLREREKAVVVCTHRLAEAERICDRFGLMHQGRLYKEGKIDEILHDSGHSNLTDYFLGIVGSRLGESS